MIRTLAAALATTTCVVALATPAAAQTREFNVPAGSLRTALDAYARQSGRQVIYGADVRSARSPGVRGARTADDALNAILAGTGFVVKQDRSGAVAIVKGGNGQSSDPSVANTPSGLDDDQAGNESAASNEIIVTGTNIRGVENRTVPVDRITRDEIDRTGYSTTNQLIDSIPQNFKGGDSGASEDGLLGNGQTAFNNLTGASGVNLRGLGNTSTLTLLNGHRIAPSAFGSVVDVSLIPLSAIDRVDVVTDGASAIYGADAVAGVVNFILRKDYDGAETRVRWGTVTSGSRREFQLTQTIGDSWSSGNVLVSAQYDDRTRLPSAERNVGTFLQPTDILPAVNQFSGLISGRQEVAPGLTVYLDGNYARKSYSSRYRFPTMAQDTSTIATNTSAYLGGTYEFGSGWVLDFGGLYARDSEDSTSVITQSANNRTTAIDLKFRYWGADARIGGPLFDLPGGSVRAVVGGSHRQENYRTLNLVTQIFQNAPLDRNVDSLFGEAYVPIVSRLNALPFLQALELSAAVRHDRYSDFGATTNPRFGIYMSPVQGVGISASYSTSFRTPTALELRQSAPVSQRVFITGFNVPTGGTGPIFLLTGGDPLSPERSKNWNVNLQLDVPGVPGARLRVGYYDINFRDRIGVPAIDGTALSRPEIFGSLITQFSSDAQAQAYVDQARANGTTVSDLLGTGVQGVRYVLNIRQQNLASVHQSGFDLSASYNFETAAGRFILSADGTIITRILSALLQDTPPIDTVNRRGQPLRFRGRASLGWSGAELQINTALNYRNSYSDTFAVPARPVRAYTTADFNIGYSPRALDGLTVRLDVINAFNARPPRVLAFGPSSPAEYDIANADALGRFVAFTAIKKW